MTIRNTGFWPVTIYGELPYRVLSYSPWQLGLAPYSAATGTDTIDPYALDSKTLGPGESFGVWVTFETGSRPPATYGAATRASGACGSCTP